METSTAILHNVNTEKLKHYFNFSTSISKSELLNFAVTSHAVSAIANNENDNIFKKWSLPLTDLCDSHGNLPTVLKCSIYKGLEFSKKILGHFGQTVNIVFHHVNGDVKSLDLYKLDDKNKISLKIKIVSAPVNTSFVEHEDELIEMIFSPSEDTKFFEFTLNESELAEVAKLSKLGSNPEIKTDYVKLYTEDGYLKATDNSFDLILHETDAILETAIEIDKSVWTMIDSDQYELEVHEFNDEKKIMVCKSQSKDLKTAVMLLSDVEIDVNFDDFDI